MKLQATLLAIAFGSLFSTSAFALGDDAVIDTTWTMTNLVDVGGYIGVSGSIEVDSESGAIVDQDQITLLNLALGETDNAAYAEGEVLRDAFGNIGVNIAAGAGNLQANDAALSAIDGEQVFASAQVFNSQLTGANVVIGFSFDADDEVENDAHVSDHVLAGAAGNVGLNVAAGNGNAQSNALAASVNDDGEIAKASADSEQASIFNATLALSDLDNYAFLDGEALAGAVGNIGVNIAAGNGNAQHNGTAIAVGGGL